MTVIIAFATNDYVLFATDRRTTNMLDTSEYYDVVLKSQKINDSVILAFSGDTYISDDSKEFLKSQDLSKANVQAVARKIRRHLKKVKEDKPDMQQTVIIGGIGDGNRVTLIQLRYINDFKIEKFVLNPNEYRYLTAFADEEVVPYLEDGINTLMDNEEGLTIENVSELTKEIIKNISEVDSFISPTYDINYIITK